jgi:hypothetical protein
MGREGKERGREGDRKAEKKVRIIASHTAYLHSAPRMEAQSRMITS